MTELWGGVEAGGTKFVCILGRGPEDVLAVERYPTSMPEETIPRAIQFFKDHPAQIEALGVASFGPLYLAEGRIASTPKPGWTGFDLLGAFQAAFDVPVVLDTDVNGAALAEGRWGAAQGVENFIYLTIGTGIGGGAVVNGQLVHGLMHPEMGHIRIPHDLEEDPFPGVCPFHSDCLEGLATGPAVKARWGIPAEEIPPEHPAWDLEAKYLALGVANHMLTYSPQRVILGGGVMEVPGLIDKVRIQIKTVLNGYIDHPAVLERLEETVVLPELGGLAGPLGAIALARFRD